MESNLAYQYEYPEELINGEAVAMSPSPAHNHIWVANNLNFIFGNYLRGKKCRVYPDGFDVHLSKKDIFKPDMMDVCDRDKIKPNGIYGAPDLVVEVLSRSTAHRDKGYKKDTYAKSGVREYWLVDPGNESIEVYLNADGVFTLDNTITRNGSWNAFPKRNARLSRRISGAVYLATWKLRLPMFSTAFFPLPDSR